MGMTGANVGPSLASCNTTGTEQSDETTKMRKMKAERVLDLRFDAVFIRSSIE
jgi:hypothetical protein